MGRAWVLACVAWVFSCGRVAVQAPTHGLEAVPEWAQGVVWYQIFPERFRNGDPSNDPTLADLEGAWPHDLSPPWQIHPWTSEWYALQPYERAHSKDIWFHIQRRRYGGDLQGILDKLDYLRDLGVGALYLNPIFWAPSSHKYDAVCYHHVDPTFGPNPSGDKALMASEEPANPASWVWTSADSLALRLIHEVHARGMRIIFDGVFNHMGIRSFAFQDVVRRGRSSPFRDWFEILSWDDPALGTRFDYRGWFGVRELPELKENEAGIVPGPRDYIFAVTRRWMDPDGDGNPSDGIDGWRLDVAFCVNHRFWKDWRRLVRTLNPQAYLVAEVIDSVPALTPYVEGDEFDAVMNYPFAFLVSDFFVYQSISASQFASRFLALTRAFRPQVSHAMMNLLGSHDTQRFASQIVNRAMGSPRTWPEYFDRSKATNPSYQVRKPTDQERQVQKLCVLFQMTSLGAPTIYYGDEVGMWGGNDPCCRKPMVWDDLDYEEESTNPDGSRRWHPDTVEVDRDLLTLYRDLSRLRAHHPALQRGGLSVLVADDERRVIAFERSLGHDRVAVILNADPRPHLVRLPVRGRWHCLWGTATQEGREVVARLAPWGGAVVCRRGP